MYTIKIQNSLRKKLTKKSRLVNDHIIYFPHSYRTKFFRKKTTKNADEGDFIFVNDHFFFEIRNSEKFPAYFCVKLFFVSVSALDSFRAENLTCISAPKSRDREIFPLRRCSVQVRFYCIIDLLILYRYLKKRTA